MKKLISCFLLPDELGSVHKWVSGSSNVSITCSKSKYFQANSTEIKR